MNIQQMMKQAQQMQDKLQKQMAEMRVEATAGGGMVTVVMNGAKQVLSLKIDPEAVSKDDVEMLQDLILAAINDAQRKADEAMSEADGRDDGRHEDPRPVLMARPDPLAQADRAASAAAGHRREERAAARLSRPQDPARRGRAPRRRDARGQGSRHLLLDLQQHHRRRSLLLLHRTRPRPPHHLRRRGAGERDGGREDARLQGASTTC